MTYTTLTWMLGIQARTNNVCLCPDLEHAMLASWASLDKINDPVSLTAIVQSGGFDHLESWLHGAFPAKEWCSTSTVKAP